MPLETQGKMVRILQDQTFQRVGGKDKVSVDVRVIASTNRDLQREMNEGHFRQDLYYRLNVVPIPVPSLRQRREDIPILAGYFVSRLSETQGLHPRMVGEDAMAVLMSHDWPGQCARSAQCHRAHADHGAGRAATNRSMPMRSWA